MKKFLLLFLLLSLPAQAQNISTTTCPGAGCIDINVAGQGTIGFQVTGTWSGTITFQASVNGTTFVTILAVPSSSTTAVSTTTANGAWQSVVAGYTTFRAVFTAYTSGTAVVNRRTVLAKGAGASGSGGGSALPGGSDTQVQFNDSGAFGGDAGLTFVKATDDLSVAGSLRLTAPADTYDTPAVLYIDSETEVVPAGNAFEPAIEAYTYWNVTGNNTGSLYGTWHDVRTTAGSVGTLNQFFGNYINIVHQGSGNLTTLFGNEVVVSTRGASTIDLVYGYYSYFDKRGSGIVPSGYGFKALLSNDSTADKLTNYYSFYSDPLIGKATNPYFLWYDGDGGDCDAGGVYRVNHFGIEAYYNPCFAEYVPAAANFERTTTRWGDTGVFGADNRAYIGVEVGGTGTNRGVNLIGANYSITSTLTPAVSDTSANSCGTGTETIVGNDNVGKVTVIGSAGTSCTVTFATAFTNAPSCFANNETTAALARATSTTSTVILAGTFLQNDVISYGCMGR